MQFEVPRALDTPYESIEVTSVSAVVAVEVLPHSQYFLFCLLYMFQEADESGEGIRQKKWNKKEAGNR